MEAEVNTRKTAAPTPRRYTTALVGGGEGCRSFLQMAAEDKLGSFRLNILGVADVNPEAPGMRYARELGIGVVSSDYHELYAIEGLELIIELTGDPELRDRVERSRPRHVRMIDHFGATLFWEVYTAQADIIRQRTLMRERVEADRTWFSQIFNSIPDELLVVDCNQQVVEANATLLHHNDLTLDEVKRKHCYELRQSVRGDCQIDMEGCPFFEVMRTRESAHLVRKHFDDDGQLRYAAIVAAPLFDHQGEILGMIESTRDITHRFKLEEELKATEVRLQAFMEMAPVATYVKNPRGQYVEINSAACQLFGLDKGAILGRTDLEVLPRETAEVFREGDRQVISQRKEFTQYERVSLAGRTVFLSTVKYPVLDSEGQVTAVCGIVKDVTALKQAELELTRTRDYLQNVLDNSPLIIITTDMLGCIVSFNPSAEEALGYSCEEVAGRQAAEFYAAPEERERLLGQVKKRGTVRDYETQLVCKDGATLAVSITLSQLLESGGRMIGTVGISKDISHRRALMDQVMQSERQAAVGRLAAGVAHEINNPLAIIGEIAGFCQELLVDDPLCEDPDTQQELVQGLPKIKEQVGRVRSITHRLLNFARKTAAKVEEADVNRCLEEILPFLEKEARLSNISIHRDYDPDLPRVAIEELQLQEIFINLINNARQAIGKGVGERGNIWLSTALDGGKVTVAVRDDGPGIDEEVRGSLFDPFVTTKAPGHGTGLGLSICYGIVKRHDGAITVESSLGLGATFKVILPAKK